MKVIGNGRLIFTDSKDEFPHKPGIEPDWQESVVIYVWDTDRQCYAFFRIGHEPDNGLGGMVVTWINIWTPDQYYKSYEDVP